MWGIFVVSSYSHKETSPVGLGPHSCDLVHLLTSSQALSPTTVTFWGTVGHGFNIGVWGGHCSLHNKNVALWKVICDT